MLKETRHLAGHAGYLPADVLTGRGGSHHHHPLPGERLRLPVRVRVHQLTGELIGTCGPPGTLIPGKHLCRHQHLGLSGQMLGHSTEWCGLGMVQACAPL